MRKQALKLKKLKYAPTLNTIIMVEETLKNMNESVITVAGLKRILPKQINHNTLMNVLEYLERSNKIYVSLRGISWIVNDSPNLRKAIEIGTEH